MRLNAEEAEELDAQWRDFGARLKKPCCGVLDLQSQDCIM